MPSVYSRRKDAEKAPAGAVYVGRGTPFGNPFVIGRDGDRDAVIEKHAYWLSRAEQTGLVRQVQTELRGKDLVCWCSPLPCHADLLLKIANVEANASSQEDER